MLAAYEHVACVPMDQIGGCKYHGVIDLWRHLWDFVQALQQVEQRDTNREECENFRKRDSKISRSNPGVYQDAGLGRMFPRSDVEAAIPAKFVGFHLDG